MGNYKPNLSITGSDANERRSRYCEFSEDLAERFDRNLRMRGSLKKFAIRYERFYRNVTGREAGSMERLVVLTRVMLNRYGQLHPESCYTDSEIDTICKAAVMHDIGKLAISADILEKPERLLPEEAAAMRRHTEYGYEFVKRTQKISSSPDARFFCDVCLMHHERWDGSGYPAGLCGDAIPLYVQIVAVVDAYDALITTRLYKPTYSHETAIEMISGGECGVFNPAVIECLDEASEEIARACETIRVGANDKQKWIYGSLKRLSISIAVTVSVLLLGIGVSVGFFASYLNKAISDDRVKRLGQIAESSSYGWQTRIESTFADLDYLASHEHPADPGHPDLQQIFISKMLPYAQYHKFYELSLLTGEEELYSSLLPKDGLSGDRASIYNIDFAAMSAAGKNNAHILASCDIYDLETDQNGNPIRDEDGVPIYKTDEDGAPIMKNGFFLAVPVKTNGICTAFLSAAYVSDEVFQSFDFDDYDGMAVAHVFARRDGHNVGQPEFAANHENFYELAARFEFEYGMTLSRFRSEIEAGNDGFVRYKVHRGSDGKNLDLFGYFLPLQVSALKFDEATGSATKSEWNLFLTVTSDFITSFSRNIQMVSFGFYSILGAALILMISLVSLRVVRLMHMTKDVSVQYEAVRKSYELSESKYKAILQQTRHMVYEYDHETGLVSHEAPSTLRYAIPESYRFEMDYPAIADRIHPEDIEGYKGMWHNILGGKERAECTMRLLTTDGHWVWNRCIMQNIYDDDMRAVRAIGFAEDVNEILVDTEKLRDTAMRDAFTGVYNKIYTGILVNKMVRGIPKDGAGRKDAFLILDLDNFKSVNDTFGHASGDAVLKNFAQLLTDNCKGHDLVGRIGGDEFVFYLYDAVDRRSVQKCAKQILDAAKSIGGNRLIVTCSIGIAYAPEEGTDFQTLYEVADKKLYEAKRAGGDRWI